MQVVITYSWDSEENMTSTSELDDTLTSILSEFGFSPTNLGIDRQKRKRVLEFKGMPEAKREFQICTRCRWKNLPDDPECLECHTDLLKRDN
jgi:hypothetical protein